MHVAQGGGLGPGCYRGSTSAFTVCGAFCFETVEIFEVRVCMHSSPPLFVPSPYNAFMLLLCENTKVLFPGRRKLCEPVLVETLQFLLPIFTTYVLLVCFWETVLGVAVGIQLPSHPPFLGKGCALPSRGMRGGPGVHSDSQCDRATTVHDDAYRGGWGGLAMSGVVVY